MRVFTAQQARAIGLIGCLMDYWVCRVGDVLFVLKRFKRAGRALVIACACRCRTNQSRCLAWYTHYTAAATCARALYSPPHTLHSPSGRLADAVQVAGTRASQDTWQDCELPPAPAGYAWIVGENMSVCVSILPHSCNMVVFVCIWDNAFRATTR